MAWFKRKSKIEFPYVALRPFSPGVPHVQLQVRSPKNESLNVSVIAILDSGADQTCLPEEVFQQLEQNGVEYNVVSVYGAVGEMVECKSYVMNLQFAGCNLHNIEVISLAGGIALLGRDVLNKHKVTLDGPNNKWVMNKC